MEDQILLIADKSFVAFRSAAIQGFQPEKRQSFKREKSLAACLAKDLQLTLVPESIGAAIPLRARGEDLQLPPDDNFETESHTHSQHTTSTYASPVIDSEDRAEDRFNIRPGSQGIITQVKFSLVGLGRYISFDPIRSPITLLTIRVAFSKNVLEQQYTFLFIPPAELSFEEKEKISKGISYYPLILAKSNPDVLNSVRSWFQQTYLAATTPIEMPNTFLESFVEDWSTATFNVQDATQRLVLSSTRDSASKLVVIYKIPGTTETIKIALPRESAAKIAELKEPETPFMTALIEHLIKTTNINFNTLTLVSVSAFAGGVSTDGRIKISSRVSKKLARKLLTDLVQVAIDQSKGSKF